MTDVDASIQDEDGRYRVSLGGGLCGQAATFMGRARQAIKDGRATGKCDWSWVEGTVSGSVLLELLEGIGDVGASAMRGISFVSHADLVDGIAPDRNYAFDVVEN